MFALHKDSLLYCLAALVAKIAMILYQFGVGGSILYKFGFSNGVFYQFVVGSGIFTNLVLMVILYQFGVGSGIFYQFDVGSSILKLIWRRYWNFFYQKVVVFFPIWCY